MAREQGTENHDVPSFSPRWASETFTAKPGKKASGELSGRCRAFELPKREKAKKLAVWECRKRDANGIRKKFRQPAR
jgi:hypothetical protein